MLQIQYDGLLKSPASWARVGRELCSALTRRSDVQLACQPRRGFLWRDSFSMPDRLRDRPESWDSPDLRLSFAYPPKLERLVDSSPLWVLSVYEASRLPPGWVEPLRRYPDRILVPSRHALRIYRQSGIPSDRLLRIPYGYNEKTIPEPTGDHETRPPVTCVTVATPHRRKGLDYLLVLSDRVREGHVRWIVHCPYRPKPQGAFWEDLRVIDRLRAEGFDVSIGVRPDRAIADLLGEADLCVQPSRSEGFGLVQLEAMAAGTPVLTAEWGGHRDFAGPGMVGIPGRLRPARRCQYDERHPDAQVFEPDPKAFRDRLLNLLEHPDRLASLGQTARRTVEDWTWEHAARRLVEHAVSEANSRAG